MLQDIDLKYVNGVLTGTKPLSVPSLTVGGTNISGPGGAQPSDHGLVGWTGDPALASTNSTLTNGTLFLTTFFVRSAVTATKVWWINTTAATTPTAGQNFVGLYNQAGTLLSSASIDTAVASNGPGSVNLGTPQTLSVGRYWIGILVNASAAPAMARTAGVSASANNLNLSAANYRFAVNGTGLTALPSSITPGSNSLTGAVALWAAVS